MIILDSPLKSLVLKLGGTVAASALQWTTSYVMNTSTCSGILDGSVSSQNAAADGGISDTSAVTIVPAPLPDTVDNTLYDTTVEFISINNTDTAASTVTIGYDDNTSIKTLFKAILQSGDQLIYNEDSGFVVYDQYGNIRVTGQGGVPSGAAGGDLAGTYPNPTVVSTTGGTFLFKIAGVIYWRIDFTTTQFLIQFTPDNGVTWATKIKETK